MTEGVRAGRPLVRTKSARKIRCPRCGQLKWKRDFYKYRQGKMSGRYATYCKECCREIKMSKYEYAKDERVAMCADGRLHVIKGGGPGSYGKRPLRGCSLYWSGSMLDYLRRNFATTPTADMAPVLRCSVRTIIRKARELGLEKSKEWMHANALADCKKMDALNKLCGNSGMIRKGEHRGREHEFKKGHNGRTNDKIHEK